MFLILSGQSAHAYPNLSLGAGYTSDCETGFTVREDGSIRHTCREGPRAEAAFDLFGGERSETAAKSSSKKSTGTSNAGGSFWHYGGGGGSWGKADEALAIIFIAILIVFVTYGLILGIISLLSSQKSFGFYYAEDYFPKADTELDGKPIPASVRRWGVQASFFPFESFSFRIHMGAGPASFAARSPGAERTYRDGFSSKIGLGFAPRPGESGFYVSGETEYLTVYSRTFKNFLENSLPTKKPEYRATTSGMLGFTIAI